MKAQGQESRYRRMWQIVFFDLPVKSKTEKKRAANFRKDLLREGYTMLQFSVYAAHCESSEHGLSRRNVIRGLLPPSGHIRMLSVTDHQFATMQNFVGRKTARNEPPPDQMMLF